MFWDTRLEKYVAYPRLWNPDRVVGRSESETFGDFPVPEINFRCDDDDPDNVDVYTSAAVQYPFAADAYFMFPAIYHHEAVGNKGPLNIQFAASRDGVQWERYDRDDHIVRGFDVNGNPTDDWQEGQLYAGYGLTRHGDEISLYYNAKPVKHGYWESGSVGGIMTRAIYRLDGFTSVDAGAQVGEFTTPPLTYEGSRLLLNTVIAESGALAVEILDSQGDPIPGFTLAEADPLSGDSVAMNVTWNGGNDLASLNGQPIQLRFVMKDVKLYAFQFVPEPTTTAGIFTVIAIGGVAFGTRRFRSVVKETLK